MSVTAAAMVVFKPDYKPAVKAAVHNLSRSQLAPLDTAVLLVVIISAAILLFVGLSR